MYSEVDVIHVIPPNDPAYRKPDVGKVCAMKRRMLIKWSDISSCCMESVHFPERWTDIATPMGLVTIDMPYASVAKALQLANSVQCRTCGMPL